MASESLRSSRATAAHQEALATPRQGGRAGDYFRRASDVLCSTYKYRGSAYVQHRTRGGRCKQRQLHSAMARGAAIYSGGVRTHGTSDRLAAGGSGARCARVAGGGRQAEALAGRAGGGWGGDFGALLQGSKRNKCFTRTKHRVCWGEGR